MSGNFMYGLVLVINVLSGLGVIGLVLIQHGKGADMGAAFGSGSSGSLFGASGSSNFLSRTTAILAAVFFITCLGLNYLAGVQPHTGNSVVDTVPTPAPKGGEIPTPSSAPDSHAGSIPK